MLKNGFLKKAIAAAVTAVMIMCMPLSAGAEGQWYKEKEHADINYEDMEYTGFELTDLRAAIEDFEAVIGQGELTEESRGQFERSYGAIVEEIEHIVTQCNLSQIYYDMNSSDEEAALEVADCSEKLNISSNEVFSALKKVLGTPFEEVLLELAGPEAIEELSEFEEMSDRELELSDEETRLNQAYDAAVSADVTVMYDGEEWSITRLLSDGMALEQEVYAEIYDLLYEELYTNVGEIYMELVAVRTEIAQINGYDNYADYAYEEIYGRDYDYEDMQAVYAQAKEYIVPLEIALSTYVEENKGYMGAFEGLSGDEIIELVEPYMEEVDPALRESFEFMVEHGLYDLDKSSDKNQGAYTISLPEYGTAFIMNNAYGSSRDIMTLVHEFGHFNADFYSTDSVLWGSSNIDVAEIQSQGLEVLFSQFTDEIYGEENADAMNAETIYNMLYAIDEGCMYDEFQQYVYRTPDLTLDDANAAFKRIAEEYGYYFEKDSAAYMWMDVHHNFQSPMYYVSYATSALAALEIWSELQVNPENAVEMYMEISASSRLVGYDDTLENAGLPDVFEDGNIERLAQSIGEAFKDDEPDTPQEPSDPAPEEPAAPGPEGEGTPAALWIVLGAAVFLAAAVIVFAVIVSKKDRNGKDGGGFKE